MLRLSFLLNPTVVKYEMSYNKAILVIRQIKKKITKFVAIVNYQFLNR